MTAQEMSLEFDLLYNNIMSNSAPGINDYEKSVLLTKAQEEIVQAIYDGSFEGSERIRESLNVLVKTIKYDSNDGGKSSTMEDFDEIAVDPSSIFFPFPEDAMFIVYETLEVEQPGCENKKKVLVKPTTHDDYYKTSNNPFKRARKSEALRLNTSMPVYQTISDDEPSDPEYVGDMAALEIVSIYSDYIYVVRYVRKPNPIIITDLPITPGFDSLTIDKKDKQADCELPEVLHRTIVDRAVQLATAAYKTVSQTDNN